MNPTKLQRGLNLCTLIVLLSANTFSLYNSFQIFHFQYSRQTQQSYEEVATQFAFLSNNFQQTTYWLYMNLKLAFTLFSELILFVILALEASHSSKSPRHYQITAAIVLVLQMFITMLSLWPFSAFSEYGQGFQIRQRQALEICESDKLSFSCRFISTMFYMIQSSKILVILTFLSLAALSTSNMLGESHQTISKERISSSVSKIDSELKQKEKYEIKQDSIFSQLIKKKDSSLRDSSKIQKKNGDTRKSSITEKCKLSSHRIIKTENDEKAKQQTPLCSQSCKQIKETAQKVQTVKKPSKIRLPSFWNSSQSRVTQDSLSPSMGSSFMEDYQSSDVENSWQPSYITFATRPTANLLKMSCESSFSTIGENTATRLANPQIGLFGHFLDKSSDQIEIDIQENKQL